MVMSMMIKRMHAVTAAYRMRVCVRDDDEGEGEAEDGGSEGEGAVVVGGGAARFDAFLEGPFRGRDSIAYTTTIHTSHSCTYIHTHMCVCVCVCGVRVCVCVCVCVCVHA